MWPDAGGPLSDEELLDLLSEEILSDVAPVVEQTREDYYVQDLTYALVADKQLYRMPPRSIGNILLDVLYVNLNGKEFTVPYISGENATFPSEFYLSADPSGLGHRKFFFRGENVGIHPTPQDSVGSFRFRYYLRPASLVKLEKVGTITTIGAAGSGGGTERRFTCSNIPTEFTTSEVYDIVRKDGSFSRTHLDLTGADIVTGASGTIDFEEDDLSVDDIQVGDYICIADQSPVPQLPDTFHSLLKQRLMTIMLQAQKKWDAARASQSKVNALEERMTRFHADRARDEPKILVPRTAPLVSGYGHRRAWGRG